MLRALPTLLAASILLAGCSSPPEAAPARASTHHACARCGREVTGPAVEWRGTLYHRACYEEVAPRCPICHQPLVGRVVRVGSGPRYHEACFNAHPRCDACGGSVAAAAGDPVKWSDGRVSCADCARTAVTKDADAAAVLDEVRADLARVLGVALGPSVVPIRLVGRPRLLELAGPDLADPNLKAFTQVEERSDGDVTTRAFEVFALVGLPRAGLYGVVAHELFHVAQARSGAPSDTDPALREGSANWVQWRLLSVRGEEARAKLLWDDDDPVYGGGFRRFAKLAADRGERDALTTGLSARRFPSGY
jgi:hypothetical protein